MRILLPLTQDQRGGIGRVATTLARALPDVLYPEDELVIFGDLPEIAGHPQVRTRGVETATTNSFVRLLREQIALPRAVAGADLVHLPDHRPLLASRKPFVITLHDMTFVDNPEWYPRERAAYKRALLRAAIAKRPRAIVTVSTWCRERLLAWNPRAIVAHDDPRHTERADATAAPGYRAGHQGPLLSHRLGDRTAQESPRLLAAFQQARSDGLRLRWKVVGRPLYLGNEILKELQDAPGVDVVGSVAQDELERLYAGATFVATPSHAEGFGYPPLEAWRAAFQWRARPAARWTRRCRAPLCRFRPRTSRAGRGH